MHRAEHAGAACRSANFTYRGWSSAALERPAAQRLARVGDVRHRRAQPEGRLPGGVPGARSSSRTSDNQLQLHVQQRHADLSSRCAIAPVQAEQPHAVRRASTSRTVDARPADAAGRRCATSTRGAGSPRARTASSPTTSSATPFIFPRPDGVTATTTSRRAWARPTTCSATARRR